MSKFSMKRKSGFTLVEIMIVVLIIGILLAIAIPNFMKARETSRTNSCIANLKQIDAAVQQYAMDKKLTDAGAVTIADLYTGDETGYLRTEPACPSGGTYTLATVGTPVTCDIAGHVLP
jgi:prepilin-type N-terminal cleavage/methylation domain-containing protein